MSASSAQFRNLPFRNPLVRDLAWSLASPPLLRRTDSGVHWVDDDWFSTISEAYRDRLAELDNEPGALHTVVTGQADKRLGNYFETLWRFWLTDNPRYRLLHANLALRSAQRTIGEFDFLVEDLESGKILHWEIAVKFYLGTADTRDIANWWGAARRDRLDIKTDRLLQHQARLSQHPAAQALLSELNLHVDETWLIVKGRLFYPHGKNSEPPAASHPAHPRGFWIHQRAVSSLPSCAWLELDRRQWLAPRVQVDGAALMDNPEQMEQWQSRPLDHPLCIAGIRQGSEVTRGFIVPDDWDS